MAKVEVYFQEPDVQIASSLVHFLEKVSKQTDFATFGDLSHFSAQAMEESILMDQADPKALTLLATLGDRVIGLCRIAGESDPNFSHIGHLFIVIDKDYWGNGLAQTLLEMMEEWLTEMRPFARLSLEVQARHPAAIHIYEKFGFQIEGRHPRGMRTKEGEFLEIYSMGRLID